MSNYTSLPPLFEDIADAIRSKTGDSSQIVADDFPTAIGAIATGVTLAPAKTASGDGSRTLSFSNLLGEPQYFVIFSNDTGTASSSSYVVTFVLYDGTSLFQGHIYYRSDQAAWRTLTPTKTWNNNTKTLTITTDSSSRIFKNNITYTLLYAY